MNTISIGECSVEVGQQGLGHIEVGRMPRGDTLQLAVHVINGRNDGPVLGLESGSHGDESFAIHIIHEVLRRLDPEQLSGALLAMPVCNPVAFETYTRLTGIGMTTDAVNLNTVFPGSPDGSLVSKMAYAITTKFVDQLDYLIDFHSGGLESAIDYTLVQQSDNPISDQVLELSKVFGSPILSTHYSKKTSATSISGVAEEKEIPAIVTMLGGATTNSDPEVLERGVQGVFNIMKHLGMIEGTPERPKKQIILGDRTLVRHQQGGLFLPEIEVDALGTTVSKGTLVGKLACPYTFETIEEYRAPFDETVFIMVRGIFGRVYPGDYAYIFGDGSTAQVVSHQ